MFNLKYQPSTQHLFLKYLQYSSSPSSSSSSAAESSPTVLMVKVSPISQSSSWQAQQNLLLDFSIRDSSDEDRDRKWAAVQHMLRELYNHVVHVRAFPQCMLKIQVFMLMGGNYATIANAIYASFVAMGIPMRYPIYAISSKSGTVVLDTSDKIPQIISGKYQQQFINSIKQYSKQIEQFKNIIIAKMNQQIRG